VARGARDRTRVLRPRRRRQIGATGVKTLAPRGCGRPVPAARRRQGSLMSPPPCPRLSPPGGRRPLSCRCPIDRLDVGMSLGHWGERGLALSGSRSGAGSATTSIFGLAFTSPLKRVTRSTAGAELAGARAPRDFAALRQSSLPATCLPVSWAILKLSPTMKAAKGVPTYRRTTGQAGPPLRSKMSASAGGSFRLRSHGGMRSRP
jgi:hypothetical protein